MTCRFRLGAMMWVLIAVAVPVAALASGIPPANLDNRALSAITGLVSTGQSRVAATRIDAALAGPALSPTAREAIEFQRTRMRRMRGQFSLTANEVKAEMRKQIRGLTDAQFDDWDAHGLFEHMYIDGKRLYFVRAPSNLSHLSAQARALRKVPTPLPGSGLTEPFTREITAYDAKVIRQATASGRTSVLPQRVEVTQTVTVDADAVPAGKTIRARTPCPRAIPGQREYIRHVASEHAAVAP